MITTILIICIVFGFIILFGNYLSKVTKLNLKNKVPNKLSESEISFLADYFHNEENCPDYDGYIGHYILPEEVMKIYRKRYSQERGWNE